MDVVDAVLCVDNVERERAGGLIRSSLSTLTSTHR